MQERNLIVPVVGNFAGPKALRAIGRYVRERQGTVRALEHAAGWIRTKLGEELTIRHVPAITFQLDRSLEEGDRVLALINQVAATTPPAPPDDETAQQAGKA